LETDRKTQIIKAAVKRFARHGLNKTTLDEIARDLRIGKATIYHYFKSKEALFYETLEYDAYLFLEDVKAILNNEQNSFKEKLVEYFNYKQEIYNKYKLLYDLMIRVLKEEGIEKEHETLKTLLQNEEDVLKIFIKSKFSGGDILNTDLAKFFTMQSWGILFGKKLNDIRNDGTLEKSGDLLLENLDNFFK
jgi:AcrR family transcriptional regulator